MEKHLSFAASPCDRLVASLYGKDTHGGGGNNQYERKIHSSSKDHNVDVDRHRNKDGR